ncbi:FAD-binding protein [Streptomyces sp. P17]|uniref:FAD-binding protein n=1 Tax=Streptomyces sp. P17 TaxID=3074716 RepID=UPI0028F3F419|nr:FAD-binding protein [Streptomyces sp. P17]MDT9699403.1 FAD-binding protein [Streptomyces sp. P17]
MTAPHPTPGLFALSEIQGPVLRPGDPGYADEVTGFNLAALHTPDVVIGATSPHDMVTALRWASATHTPVAVQATGHGANFPIDHGLLINTTRMTDVTVTPETRTANIGVLAAPPAAEAIEQATSSLHNAMAPYGTGHTMVNIHGTPGNAEDRARAWTPEVLTRLRQAKKTYDPDNLLRYGHTVT